jgi:hypothetical protein
MSKDKNSAKKENPNPTLAKILFQDKQILNKRPEGMDFKEYQFLRKMQNEVLKRLFRGAPSKRLNGIMGINHQAGRVSRGVRGAVRTPRKAS